MQKEPISEFQKRSFILTNFRWSRILLPYIVKKSSILFLSHNFTAKNFLTHWTWISHLTKDNKDTNHTNGIHTSEDRTITNPGEGWSIWSPKQTFSEYKRSLMSDIHPNQLAKKPKWHSIITDGPQWHTDIRTYWQNAQAALRAHKCFPIPNTWEPIDKNAQQRFLLANGLNVRHTSGPISKMPK